jgi:formylglycine-generating enzyme
MSKPVEIFIAYSRKDTPLLDKFRVHLQRKRQQSLGHQLKIAGITLSVVLGIFFIYKMASGGGSDPGQRIKADMVLIPGGTFDMGCTSEQKDCAYDESPVTRVTVNDFYIGKYEVTVRDFQQFINATDYKTDADKEGSSRIWTGSSWETKNGVNWKCDVKGNIRPSSEYDHPVIHVSWNDAVAYCNWLSEKENLGKVYTISGSTVTANWSAKGYRLPTEAEWEYAARGRGQQVLFGNRKNVADPAAINFDASASRKKDYSIAGEYRQKTVPVGSLNSPNTLGLHDMSGNVWEWCWDWYANDYYTKSNNSRDPRGPGSGSFRVRRGGSWYSAPQHVQVAVRNGNVPSYSNGNFGFRLARTSYLLA